MSTRISVKQVESDLSALLDQVSRTGEEFVVQREGKDCAVIVSARQWRRRNAARQLDATESAGRLPKIHQQRVEVLLEAKKKRTLTSAERQELKDLLRESDAVMLRRAKALDASS